MPFDTDIQDILRAELGEGFELAGLAPLKTEYLKRQLSPKLKALYRRRIDTSALVQARVDAETALRAESVVVAAAVAASDAQAEADMEGLT